MVIAAIRQKATSTGTLWKVPQLMDALQNDFKTDMDLNDIKALYDFGAKLSDSSFIRLAITDQDLVDNFVPYSRGSCGALDAYALCPEDPTYQTWHSIFSHVFVDRRVLQERAPVQLVNATTSSDDLEMRLGRILGPLGLNVSNGPRRPAATPSVIYDYSGGRYPQTAAWLEEFFGSQVVPVPSPPDGAAGTQQGLVVAVGSEYARHWYGQS
jgi:hypothetical protein